MKRIVVDLQQQSVILWYVLPLIHTLQNEGWERSRVQQETKQHARVEWWRLSDGQCIRVEFEGVAFAVGKHRAETMQFLSSADTSDDATARAAGCWTTAEIEAARSEGRRIYHDTTRSIAARADGLYDEIRAVYQRDRRNWIVQWRLYEHPMYQNPPDETTYAAHWLMANGDGYDEAVIKLLKLRYPFNGELRLKLGSTQFLPPLLVKPKAVKQQRAPKPLRPQR